MIEHLRAHSQDTLRKQLYDEQRHVDEDLLPPGVDPSSVLDMSIDQLKETFPVRVSLYTTLLRYSSQFRSLPSEEKREMEERLHVLNAVGKLVRKVRLGEDTSLRPMQAEAIEKIYEGLEKGQTDFNIELPTGVGKTRIFIKLAEAIKRKGIIPVPKILIIYSNILILNLLILMLISRLI